MKSDKVERFLIAQNQVYLKALAEIRSGKKLTHWMWYIFPQVKGLGQSENANYYSIRDLEEAAEYLRHPVLGKNLIEITSDLLLHVDKTALEIFGTPDDMKLRSSMTLFAQVKYVDPVFQKVLNRFFDRLPDPLTLELLRK